MIPRYIQQVRYVMRERYARIIMVKGKRFREYPILIAECLIMWRLIAPTIQKNIQKITVESVS